MIIHFVRLLLAEGTRFELVVGLLLRQFSKLLVSATHPSLLFHDVWASLKRLQSYQIFLNLQNYASFI